MVIITTEVNYLKSNERKTLGIFNISLKNSQTSSLDVTFTGCGCRHTAVPLSSPPQ